jgi:glycosyltransferase involved in cell wall biosynthesis
MRVLIVSRLAGRGGVETHLYNLARLLTRHGAEVTVASRFALRESRLVEERHSLPVRLLTTPFAGDLRWFRLSTAAALLTWPPRMLGGFDRILTTEISALTAFYRRFLRRGGQLWWNRAGNLARPDERPSALGLAQLDGLVVESELQAAAARSAYRLTIPIRSIPLLAHVGAPPVRPAHPLTGPMRVSFLGRFVEDKGIFRLLDLWPRLADARLTFHGNGPERDRLINEVRARGLEGRVAVRGPWATAAELAARLADSDLVALLSRDEGLPLVLMEALAHGVPFVATDVGAVRTLQHPDVRLVHEWDPDAAVAAFADLERRLRTGSPAAALQAFHREKFGRVEDDWRALLL